MLSDLEKKIHFNNRPLFVDDAVEDVLRFVQPNEIESVPLHQSLGHVLAVDVVADMHVPPFSKSMMDGYAIRSVDVETASFGKPVLLQVVDTLVAGDVSRATLQTGQAIRIMTGAPIPDGADAVCRFEQTKEGFDTVEVVSILTPIRSGESISPCGEDMKKGTTILRKGTKITPAEGSILATFGVVDVPVYQRPRVGIVSTGSELVDVNTATKQIPPGKIRNSNSTMVAQLIQEQGGNAQIIEHAPDHLETLLERFQEVGQTYDVVVFTGGVSVGDKDYIPQLLAQAGVNIVFWKVLIRPGQPALFGVYNRTLVFGLSGNPAACFVNTLLFVLPAIRKMMGYNGESVQLPTVKATLIGSVDKKPIKHTRFLRAKLFMDQGIVRVDIRKVQSSAILSSFLDTNCLVRVDAEHYPDDGDLVNCILYGRVREETVG